MLELLAGPGIERLRPDTNQIFYQKIKMAYAYEAIREGTGITCPLLFERLQNISPVKQDLAAI